MFVSTSRRIVSNVISKNHFGLATALQTPFASMNKIILKSSFCSSVDPKLEEEYSAEIASVLDSERKRQERRGSLEGEVVSTKTSKTINVMVYHNVYMSKYQKTIRRRKKIMAHDPEETAKIGDYVCIIPSRPYSARKRHILKDIIRRARIVDFSDLNAKKVEEDV